MRLSPKDKEVIGTLHSSKKPLSTKVIGLSLKVSGITTSLDVPI